MKPMQDCQQTTGKEASEASSWDHWESQKGNGMQNPELNKTYPANTP